MTSAESTEDSAHPEEKSPEQQPQHQEQHHDEHQDDALKTLKYHLLGPSLTKAGQDKVDQSKVSEIIYNASKGSKFFTREEERDKILTKKIEQILSRKKKLEQQDLTRDLRNADRLLAELELSRDLTQHIVHLDCDAFFAAVELLERPDLKDVPFAVGGGVLTTCNYVARQFGCRSGMAGFVAKKLCPQLILIKPNFHKYGAKAQEVREVLANYDPRFESASIDEAYLNITEYCDEHNMDPAAVVEQMRKEVHEKTSITVSAGIAANARLAKICSNINKPNGQYVLPCERSAIMAFMRDLPTRKVNGIGRVLERELLEIGVKTCGDLYEQRQYLNRLFGDKYYVFLLRCYLGLGRTKIQPAEEYERKSVGTESTFHDISDPAKLRDKLRSTAEALEKDLKKNECKGRTLCIKIKLHTFEVYTRQVVLPKSIQLADDLYNYSLPMLAKLEQEMPGMKLRLMGLRCTHLVSTKKPDTMAFFGFKPRRQDAGESSDTGMVKRKASEPLEKEDEWEKLGTDDDDLLEDLDDSLDNLSREHEGEEDEMLQDRRHGKEIVPNPPPERGPQPEEDWWECPICLRPQAANERQFNEHIDLCLSRQTIRDAVQADDPKETKPVPPDVNKRPKLTEKKLTEKKRGRPPSTDPKQKKLSFF
ncbi:DNA polymerase kappa, a Y family lesion bypass polymerase [Trichoderma guizhouense]|uniref:DNA polymerase kappa n=1 Tax=Trichoderma guizhouense TaxID=1491466 RepID=A0A1T3C9W4_9HYPO|nr:DNA polymerase kappa, a Y family lesion bypass polymerase [Trichoderma guizhouense]